MSDFAEGYAVGQSNGAYTDGFGGGGGWVWIIVLSHFSDLAAGATTEIRTL